jgi:hypothetical protein
MDETNPTPKPETPSTPPPAQEPIPQEPAVAQPIKEQPKPKRGVLYTLFSPETRFGRGMRKVLRTLALIVGSFALGMLAAYLMLYRPVKQQLAAAQQESQQNAAQVQQVQADLDKANANLKTTGARADQLQAQLDIEVARSQVLRAMNQITNARMALAAKDKAGTVKALDASQAFLKPIMPTLEKLDSAEASTLTALFTLSKNDLDRDTKLASQDLDRLQAELELAEKNVLKSSK